MLYKLFFSFNNIINKNNIIIINFLILIKKKVLFFKYNNFINKSNKIKQNKTK